MSGKNTTKSLSIRYSLRIPELLPDSGITRKMHQSDRSFLASVPLPSGKNENFISNPELIRYEAGIPHMFISRIPGLLDTGISMVDDKTSDGSRDYFFLKFYGILGCLTRVIQWCIIKHPTEAGIHLFNIRIKCRIFSSSFIVSGKYHLLVKNGKNTWSL